MNIKLMIRKFPLLTRMAKSLRTPLGRGYMTACHALSGVKKDTVFFSSFVGRSYNDSPRYICEELLKLRPDTQIVWQLSANASGRDRLPAGVQTVPPHSLKALKAIATARVIVDNFNRPVYMPKFADQYYVQTWHGDRAIKKVLFDMNDGVEYSDRKYMDLAISGSDSGTRLYRSAFRYEGEVLQCGIPRNDVLLHPDEALIARTREVCCCMRLRSGTATNPRRSLQISIWCAPGKRLNAPPARSGSCWRAVMRPTPAYWQTARRM